MPFGLETSSGNFRDIVKYHALAGQMLLVERDPYTGEKENKDITGPATRFAVDFGTLEVGYVAFTSHGPVRTMVPYDGRPLPPQPQEVDDDGKLMARPGFFVLVIVHGVVREWCGSAAILTIAMEELFTVFSNAPEAAAGKIPLVSIVSTISVTVGKGTQKSTVRKPVFKIVGWVERSAELGKRTVPPPGAKGVRTGSTPAAADTAPLEMPVF